MGWDDIIGNDAAKNYLQHLMISTKISNTLFFHGPDGIGKSLFALEFASHLMYPQGYSKALEGRIFQNNHPDLHIYFPEGKTLMHPIASIRELIAQVFLAPFEASNKVFIIHDAERMLSSSANALLKTLEEPTLDSYIILLSSNPNDVLPTILSRCQKISFAPLSEDEVYRYLSTKMSQEKARHFAGISHGSIGKALAFYNHPEQDKAKKLLVKILSKSTTHYIDFIQAIKDLSAIYKKENNETQWHKDKDMLLMQILLWYRDLYSLKEKQQVFYFSEEIDFLKKINLNFLPSFSLVQQHIEEIRQALDRNMHLYSCLEHLFLELDLI